MHSRFPSHNDINAPYRDAIASVDEGHAFVATDSGVVGQNQPHPLQGRPRRTNRDQLNAIANQLGAGVSSALTLLGNSLERPRSTEVATETAPTHLASSSQPARQTTLDDLIQAFALAGIPIAKKARGPDIRTWDRLSTLRLTTDTLLSAIHLAQTPEHASMAALGLNHTNKQVVLTDLSSFIKSKASIRVIEAAASSNNDPVQLIGQLLSSYK